MSTINKAGHLKQKTEYKIRSLSQTLSTFSAVPNKEHSKTAAFISLHDAFQPAAEYDGMLGSIMMESFLADAFSSASANDNGAISMAAMLDTPAAELMSEFIGESDSHNNYGRGRGSIALYERFKTASPAPAFNIAANDDYPADFDQRMDAEEALASLQREYYTLDAAERLQPLA